MDSERKKIVRFARRFKIIHIIDVFQPAADVIVVAHFLQRVIAADIQAAHAFADELSEFVIGIAGEKLYRIGIDLVRMRQQTVLVRIGKILAYLQFSNIAFSFVAGDAIKYLARKIQFSEGPCMAAQIVFGKLLDAAPFLVIKQLRKRGIACGARFQSAYPGSGSQSSRSSVKIIKDRSLLKIYKTRRAIWEVILIIIIYGKHMIVARGPHIGAITKNYSINSGIFVAWQFGFADILGRNVQRILQFFSFCTVYD
ncbi:hypothetical protein D3C72_852500 [compost metagenome]